MPDVSTQGRLEREKEKGGWGRARKGRGGGENKIDRPKGRGVSVSRRAPLWGEDPEGSGG